MLTSDLLRDLPRGYLTERHMFLKSKMPLIFAMATMLLHVAVAQIDGAAAQPVTMSARTLSEQIQPSTNLLTSELSGANSAFPPVPSTTNPALYMPGSTIKN